MCEHYLRICDTKRKLGHLTERLQIAEMVFIWIIKRQRKENERLKPEH
jgi:hypothetical protein